MRTLRRMLARPGSMKMGGGGIMPFKGGGM
jgi:hypothetical protein